MASKILIESFTSCSVYLLFRVRQEGAEGMGMGVHHHIIIANTGAVGKNFRVQLFFLFPPFSLFLFSFSLEWDGSESVHLFRWLMVVGGGHVCALPFFFSVLSICPFSTGLRSFFQ